MRGWALILSLLGACTPSSDSTPADPPVELGKIQLRAHVVTVHAGDAGPSFTVAQSDGTVLLESVDAKTFERRFPGLFRDYETAFARGDGPRPVLDASI